MAGADDDTDYEGFFIEFVPVGGSVKVSAVDPLTGLEAVIVGSSLTPSHVLANAAVRKLKALLGMDDASANGEPAPKSPPPRRGLIV